MSSIGYKTLEVAYRFRLRDRLENFFWLVSVRRRSWRMDALMQIFKELVRNESSSALYRPSAIAMRERAKDATHEANSL